MSDVEIMDKSRLAQLSFIILFCLAGCDISPEDTGLTSSSGLVNKGVMSNAEVTAYKAGTLEFVKRTYTNSDGTFVFENLDYQGVIYVEVTTTSQTLSTCDATTGCGEFKDGLKLPGEYDKNLNGVVDFGDIHYYNDPNFKLTSFINPNFNDLENFGEFAVTPLTHIAAQRIISEGVGTATGVDTINAQVAELFGLEGVDITRLVPPDVTDEDKMSNATDAERMYSTLNAAVASSVTNTKDLVSVISELTDSFVNDGGLVGNSSNSEATTLATLQGLAEDVADTVESDLGVNMDAVQQKIQQEESENLSATPDALIEPVVTIEDSDGDGLTDTQENEIGTNPDSADTDSDGMKDGWEVTNSLNPLVSDESLDPDRDGLTNLQEFSINTDPQSSDTDQDGMLDMWEYMNGLNPLLASDAVLDSDSDSLTNLQEHSIGSNPFNSDSDSDGMPDEWEFTNGLNPISNGDASVDNDTDGLSNVQEYILNTNPVSSDTDGDEILDGYEDFDADGLQDRYEFIVGTDPFNSDTDNDTIPDDEDSADGDDIPDGVEVIEGLALGQDDGVIDFDGDTVSNEIEHENGSNVHSPTPILEFVSDAGIFESINDVDGARFTIDENQFISSYYDTNDRSFVDGVTDNNQLEDLLTYDLNSNTYTLPLRQYSGSSLITGHYVTVIDSTPDGKRSLLMSASNQIVNADSNEMFDLFVYDHFSNKVTRLASPSQFDYGSFLGSLSADGTKVAFTTMTKITGTLDNDATNDVYLMNMLTDDIKLVSSNNAGDGSATGQSGVPKMSADASRIIFLSNADDMNLDSGSQGSTATDDLYVYDVASGKTKRVSTVVAAIDSVGSIILPQISKDGSSAVFYTQRDVLQKGSQPVGYQLYYVNLDSCFTGSSCSYFHVTNAQGSTNYSGSTSTYDGDIFANLSADGDYVIHKSDANDLNALDVVTDGQDVFLWDRQTQTNQLVTQYLYDDTKTIYESDPTLRPDGMYYLNLGIGGITTTPDFTNVYMMMNYGSQVLNIMYPENCGEVGCLHRIALNLSQQDSDGDGLNDRQEISLNSGLNNMDTDADGLNDGEEMYTYGTSPIHADSDGDGWDDQFEVNQQTLPNVFNDTDGDGLSDADEAIHGTSVNVADTDSDGLTDGQEITITQTSPILANTDGDGVLLDGHEDSDADGLTDADEINNHHTDWTNPDTDGDSVSDSQEISDGSDPLDPNSTAG